MKTFIGIGSDHEKDVFDRVQAILAEHSPEAITVELGIDVENVGESCDNPRWDQRKAELLEGNQIYEVSGRRRPVIKVKDFFPLNGPGSYSFYSASEVNAGIDFAVRNGLPFYFVEWSDGFPDMIGEFKDGKMNVISLKGKTTYQDHPEEFGEYQGEPEISGHHVEARNRFSSDAINYLFKRFDSIAHIGGVGHFDSSWESEESYGLAEGMELQNLVFARRKTVYDLVKDVKTGYGCRDVKALAGER